MCERLHRPGSSGYEQNVLHRGERGAAGLPCKTNPMKLLHAKRTDISFLAYIVT